MSTFVAANVKHNLAIFMVTAVVLTLSACSDDRPTLTYAIGAKVHCGGKQALVASGSTAQANAMSRFVDAYGKACSGQTLRYTAPTVRDRESATSSKRIQDNKPIYRGSDIPSCPGDAPIPARLRKRAVRRVPDAWNTTRGLRPHGHHHKAMASCGPRVPDGAGGAGGAAVIEAITGQTLAGNGLFQGMMTANCCSTVDLSAANPGAPAGPSTWMATRYALVFVQMWVTRSAKSVKAPRYRSALDCCNRRTEPPRR